MIKKTASFKCAMAFATAVMAVTPQASYAQSVPEAPGPDASCTGITVDREYYDGYRQGLRIGLGAYGVYPSVEIPTHANNHSYVCGRAMGHFCLINGVEMEHSDAFTRQQRLQLPQDYLQSRAVARMTHCLGEWETRFKPFR